MSHFDGSQIPKEETPTPPVNTGNAGDSFYNKEGQIVNPDTAHERANTTIAKEEELLQTHKETTNDLEKLTGGFLEVGKKMIEKHPDLFYTKTDKEGNPFVISKTIRDARCPTRIIVFSKENIARVTTSREAEVFDLLPKITPEVLSNWNKFLIESREPTVDMDPDLQISKGRSLLFYELYGLQLQKLTDSNLFESSVKKPIDILIKENEVPQQQTLEETTTKLSQMLGV